MDAEDRQLLARINAERQLTREFNRTKMDDAGVPQPARRGFYVASGHGEQRITKIEEYARERGASRWLVEVELYAGSHSRSGFIVGPRGAVRPVY